MVVHVSGVGAPPRWILHADMDAFYASVEQRDHPELRGQPVIVGANSPRGVVSAASYEARAFGVRSAMPGFRARELCPHGHFVGGDMKKYVAVSRDVHRVFREFTDDIEPLALDEAFLDIAGSVRLFGPPLEIGRQIKARVREATQLPVSIGIGPNKLVAKIACGLGKPNGLLLVRPDEVRPLLDPLPLRTLWGIGPRTEELLTRGGLRTLGDVVRAPVGLLRTLVGDRAEELQRRARGEDDRPVVSERDPKSIGEEATFERDVTDPERISAAITAHAEAIASRARRAGFRGRTITLKVKLAHRRGSKRSRTDEPAEPIYPLLSRSKTIPTPTEDGAEIRRVALELWQRAGVREPIRLLGVSLSGLTSGGEQLDLFAETPSQARARQTRPVAPHPASTANPKRSALGRALDAIEDRFGPGKIGRAVERPTKITHGDRLKAGERDPRKDD